MKNNQLGMTLVEVLIAMVLMALAIQGAMSLMTFTTKTKSQMDIKGSLKLANLQLKKVSDKALEGLDKVDFTREIFYSIDSSGMKPLRINENTEIVNKTVAEKSSNSSFSFYKKLKTRNDEIVKTEIVSYCVKYADASIIPSREELQEVTHWPFVRFSNTGNMIIQCCKKSEPNCTDDSGNVLNYSTSEYVVQSAVYSWKNGAVINKKSLIKEGEKRFVNAQGFFIYMPSSNAKQLRAVIYTYWNDCISKKLINQETEGCNSRYHQSRSKIQKTFDLSLGSGINDLGDLDI